MQCVIYKRLNFKNKLQNCLDFLRYVLSHQNKKKLLANTEQFLLHCTVIYSAL
jgi:hypothetical protein